MEPLNYKRQPLGNEVLAIVVGQGGGFFNMVSGHYREGGAITCNRFHYNHKLQDARQNLIITGKMNEEKRNREYANNILAQVVRGGGG